MTHTGPVRLGLLMAAPALGQTPRPTLTFDRACYGEQEVMDFAGEQYTPWGEVVLLFANNGEIGDVPLTADAAGAIAGRVQSPDPERFLAEDDERDTVSVTANDQTRQQDGTLERDPEATFAAADITVTRTRARFVPAEPKPGRKLRVHV